MRCLITFLIVFLAQWVMAQETFTCVNKGYGYLNQIIGQWQVKTTDRTSPGVYQDNSGKATISPGIDGCGISISYRGIYKNKAYAREVSLIALDSVHYQMVALDSEHGSYSFMEGTIEEGRLEVYWFRNKEIGKLQSKYVLEIENETTFEFSSFLSNDFGVSWVLTHQRKYLRDD